MSWQIIKKSAFLFSCVCNVLFQREEKFLWRKKLSEMFEFVDRHWFISPLSIFSLHLSSPHLCFWVQIFLLPHFWTPPILFYILAFTVHFQIQAHTQLVLCPFLIFCPRIKVCKISEKVEGKGGKATEPSDSSNLCGLAGRGVNHGPSFHTDRTFEQLSVPVSILRFEFLKALNSSTSATNIPLFVLLWKRMELNVFILPAVVHVNNKYHC